MTDHIFNKEALRRVAELLETRVEPEHFNLSDWGAFYAEDIWDDTPDKMMIPHNCESTACACGYAGLDDWFREKGFRTDEIGCLEYESSCGTYYTGWAAVRTFFCLTYEEAAVLFSEEYYDGDNAVTPKDVAERIRHFLKDPEGTIKDCSGGSLDVD